MQFGRVEDSIADIDFSLPPDSEGTRTTLARGSATGDFNVYVGASKWAEKSWMGKIYPPKTPDNTLLSLYAQHFNTVEFGPSFYTTYTADQLRRWVDQVAGFPDFKFCPRFSQQITHIRRFKNVNEQSANFFQSLTAFGNQLGPLMLQLPETLSPKSFEQFGAYLRALPPFIKVAVEVRHKNWFAEEESRQQLFSLLRELQIGTIISDTAGRRDAVHMELTTKEAFIRFVGNNLVATDYARLNAWVKRIKDWKAQGLQSLWFFMHQDDERHVPEAADYLIKNLNAELGTAIAAPKLIQPTGSRLF